jgi:hypothetical protein
MIGAPIHIHDGQANTQCPWGWFNVKGGELLKSIEVVNENIHFEKH